MQEDAVDHQPLHVLLVEDSDAHAMNVEKVFQGTHKEGTIDRVRDGMDAIAYVRRQDQFQNRTLPHVILLDLKLPRMDGHQVLRTLKGDDRFKMIPVVILTTSETETDVCEAYRLHANSYLVKPVDFARFRQLIGAVTSYWGAWNRPALEA